MVVKRILVIVALSALGIGGWYLFRHAPQAIGMAREAPGGGERAGARDGGNRIPGLVGRDGAVNVVLAPVEENSGGETVTALGTAMAAQSVTLFPQVSGVVTEILFTAGQDVEKGTPLLRLEDDEEQVAVERATIELAHARDNLARARQLAESRTIADVALSDVETAARLAEVELRSAEIALSRRTIAAPFGGIVGLTGISVGDLVSASTPITTIEDLSTIRVAFEVPERFAPRLALGQAIRAEGQGIAGLRTPGHISGIDNHIDAETRTLKLEAELANRGNLLKTGMAVTVFLDLPSASELSVPTLAVQWDREGSFVWKAVEGAAHRTEVDIVRRNSGFVTVMGELTAGDRVVVEGVQRLREGARLAEVDVRPALVGPREPEPPAADAEAAPQAAAEIRG